MLQEDVDRGSDAVVDPAVINSEGEESIKDESSSYLERCRKEIERVMPPENVAKLILALARLGQQGDVSAAKLALEHLVGKSKDPINLDSTKFYSIDKDTEERV